jgi:hypothetical protein
MSPDVDPWSFVDLDANAPATAPVTPSRCRRAPPPLAEGQPGFLSVLDLQARWSCGRTFVYAAITEMERRGYLRRLQLGRVQRIALASVEAWEAAHSKTPRAERQVALARPRRAPASSSAAAWKLRIA